MNVGEKIYRIRKMSGMTQEELADKMNVSRQTVSKWETGTSAPDLENAVRLCELFQISLDDFMKGGATSDNETKISLQDIIKINRRSQQMTITLLSGLFFIMIGTLAAVFIGALINATGSIEYMLYRYIAVGEYAYVPVNYLKTSLPALILIAIGAVLCAVYFLERRREKRNEK